MVWSREMEQALITLGELADLASAIRRKLKSTNEDVSRSFETYSIMFQNPLGEEPRPAPGISERISYQRFMEMKDKQRLRIARRTLFASGYSAVERFLVLRVPGCNPKSKFSYLKLKLLEALNLQAEEGSLSEKSFEKLNYYRIARNKIVHQCGLVNQTDSDDDEKTLLAANLSPVFLDEVEGHEDLKEIVVQETFLGDYFSFLQDFATDIDGKLHGATPC
jgi:hypothetical protein